MTISAQSILEAHSRILPYIHQTPVLTNQSINKMTGSDLFFKCENFQKAGAFKSRGACNAVFSMNENDLMKGVCTHSSGNHAQALARAAALRDIKAHIVMPEDSSPVKVSAVKSYGGLITFCKPTLEDRETTLKKVQQKTGAIEIHPYDNPRIIEGQATAALELIREIPGLDYIIAPVGGGGLLSGTILSAQHWSPATAVIAAEPENADDASRSLISGRFIPSVNPDTIADGLRTSLGVYTYPIIAGGVHSIITVSEAAIVAAMKLIWERMKIVVETSSATVLAAIFSHAGIFAGKRTGLIISGGNADPVNLPW